MFFILTWYECIFPYIERMWKKNTSLDICQSLGCRTQIYVKMIHIPQEILPAMLTWAFYHYAIVTTLYVRGCTLAIGLSMHTASPERGQGSIPLLSFLSLFPTTLHYLPLNTPESCITEQSCHIEKALFMLKAWRCVQKHGTDKTGSDCWFQLTFSACCHKSRWLIAVSVPW